MVYFIGCSSLTSVNIPNSVTSLESFIFYECSSLTSITIPEGVTSIEGYVFNGCNSLTSISIPKSVTSIRSDAFRRCSSLTEINVSANNKKYISINGVLFNKEKTELIKYPSNKNGNEYNIPNSVTKIAENAFYGCNNLTSVNIPNSVTSIESDAFYGCSSLTSINIPEGVTKIAEYAFENCSNMISIIIPNSVTSIGRYAFYGCSSLTSITIPNSVTSIEDSAFEGCSSLTYITIPEGVTRIESSVFERCKSLTSINIPESVTTIDSETFKECNSLKNLIIPESVEKIGKDAFSGVINIICKTNTYAHEYAENNGLRYILSDNISSNYTAEYQLKETEEWDISENGDRSVIAKWNLEDRSIIISGIGRMKDWDRETSENWHRKYQKLIEKVIIRNGVTTIGEYAFRDCNNLTNIIIPNSVTSIDFDAFYMCSSLKSINIPESVINIGECSSFSSGGSIRSLTEINVSDSNPKYISIDGVLYNKEKTEIIRFPSNKEDKEYSILDGVTRINWNAFSGCSNLTNVNIPNSVTSIESDAFYVCSNLINVNIPNSVTSIGGYAFAGCRNLKNITIPKSVENIRWNAFSGVINIICKTNSYVHKYAEENKILYLLDDEGPTVELSKNGENQICMESSTLVQIEDVFSGLNEDSIKYVWSDKETITKDEITEFFTNGEIINTPRNIDGNYYLYIYAEDLVQNETIYKSNVFKIDSLAPTIEVKNNPTEKTNQNVIVTLTANEEIQGVKGWTLSKDKKVLTKKYTENVENEEIQVKDILGNETKQIITVNNIDKIAPTVKITYSSTENPEQNVTVKLTADEEIQTVEGWTLSKNKKVLTKKYEENVENEEITIKDIAGNETKQIVTISNIDRESPEVTIEYSTKELTNQNVIVTVTAGEELQEVEGWTLSNDKKVLTKEYEQNIENEEITIKDIAGNETKQRITINNIDKAGPKIDVKYSTAEKTNQNVIVTLTANEEIQGVKGWTLSKDKKVLTKKYTENVENEEIQVKDILGNETKQTIKVSNIDKTAPKVTVTYSTKELTKQNVTVTLTTSEEVQAIAGWTLSEDKKILTKQYEQNVANEEVIVKDIAGNEIKQTVTISNIDRKAPEVTVEYSSKERTKENVIVTIKADEELQGLEGWKLSEDKKILTKEYEDSVTENLVVKDIAGNETKQTIKITNIDKKGPKIEINYSTTEKTKENVTVTLRTDEEVQDVEEGWTLSENKKELTKTYTENKTETISLKDELANETKQTIKVSNIDRISPTVTVTYSTKELTNQNVTVTLTASEEVQAIAGWTLSEDKKILTKQYEQNVANEEIIIKDIAGNETKQKIAISNIDKMAPAIFLIYSTIEKTDQNVLVTIKTNEEIQAIEGWTISQDKKQLSKEYTRNTTETITIKDIAGNETKQTITINNIDKTLKTSGDINGNNKIDIGDILLIKRHMAYTNSTIVANKHSNWKLSDEKIQIGDLNNNGKIDIGDILKLQRYISASNSKEVAQKHKDWLNL